MYSYVKQIVRTTFTGCFAGSTYPTKLQAENMLRPEDQSDVTLGHVEGKASAGHNRRLAGHAEMQDTAWMISAGVVGLAPIGS